MDRLKILDSVGLDPDDNLLIRGEASRTLAALECHQNYASRLVGQVKLAYLDPPYNTGHINKHYRDKVDPYTWNTSLKDTLAAVQRFLADDGIEARGVV